MENSLKYAAKGQRVLVQGRLIYGEIKDNEGVIRQTSSIVADDIIYFKWNQQYLDTNHSLIEIKDSIFIFS